MVESHRQEIAKLEALYASNPGGRVFVHLAEALRRGGEHERARSILAEGLARHPDSASGYVVLGRVLIDRGETEEAESAFRRVLELDGGNLVALRWLGDLARSAGRPAEAAARYRELLARNPAGRADSSLMRLLEEAQRSAEQAAAREEESRAAAAEGEVEPAAAGVAPADSAAPGRTGPAKPAEAEYGMIELDALPGDLASFAGLASPERAGAADEPEPEPRGLEDDVVVLIESSAAPLELEELETELAAAPAEVNLLSATPDMETPPATDASSGAPPWSAEAAPEPEFTIEGTESTAAEGLDVPAGGTGVEDVALDLSAADPMGLEEDVASMATAGDMDVDSAMLNVGELADARPYEVVPDAAELTLIDDESVRVSLARSEAESADSAGVGEASAPADELPSARDEPTSTSDEAAGTGEATRPEPTEYVTGAGEAAGYDDLPWLVDPSEAAGAGAGEETDGAEEAATATAAGLPAESEPQFAPDLEPGAAGDGGLELPHEVASDARAAAPEYGDELAVPVELTHDFEAQAEPFGAEAEASLDETVSGREESVERGSYFADFDEGVVTVPDSAGRSEEIEREPDLARFAEDVEAEPDLATFMESIAAEGDVISFLEEVELAGYDEPAHGEADLARFAEDVDDESLVTDYVEDVEAEPELAGSSDDSGRSDVTRHLVDTEPEDVLARYADDLVAEPQATGPFDDAEPELVRFADIVEPEETHRSWLEDFEAAGADAAAASGGAEFDEPAPFEREEREPEGVTAREANWQDEIATTGGPEPAAASDVFGGADGSYAEAAAGTDPTAEPGASASELGTETLADLYRAQGFAQRAADVYRALLLQRPSDEQLAAKLRDAERAAAAERTTDGDGAEDAGEVWLRGVESAWTGGAGATGQETTPYAWTEREEREQGIGIGAYLRDLISWGTGETARRTETVEPESDVPAAPSARDDLLWGDTLQQDWSPSAEPEPEAEPQPWSGPDAAAAEPAAAEAAPAEAAPAEPAVDAEAGEPLPVVERTADEPEPFRAAGASGTWTEEETPADPWLAPEPAAVRGEPAEPAQHATAANAVEEAFNEWFGPPAEDAAAGPAQPRREAQAGREAQPAKVQPAKVQPAADAAPGEPSSPASEDEDDEDLEMFRAWLQSLKK